MRILVNNLSVIFEDFALCNMEEVVSELLFVVLKELLSETGALVIRVPNDVDIILLSTALFNELAK